MENDYILTSTEFARIIGTSTESLRSRRRRGMYNDQYVLKNKSYRWKRPRHNQVGATGTKFRDSRALLLAASGLKHGARNKNNGNHKRGARTNYPNKAFELANEFKMVLKSQRKIAAAAAEEITPEIIELAQHKHREKLLEKCRPIKVRRYTSGIFNCKYAQPQWQEFKDEPEEEKIGYIKYY